MSDAGLGPKYSAYVDCTESLHQLYHYLDGELTEDRRAAIRAHLEHCGPCVAAFDFEAELRKVVADRCKDRVPEQLQKRIAEAIRHESAKSQDAGR